MTGSTTIEEPQKQFALVNGGGTSRPIESGSLPGDTTSQSTTPSPAAVSVQSSTANTATAAANGTGNGGATAALAAFTSAGGTSNSNSQSQSHGLADTSFSENALVGGATAALAADESCDISSIGSGTAGSMGGGTGSMGGGSSFRGGGWSGGGSLNRERDRSTGNLHRRASSVIGLDTMIDARREEGGLTANVVHMEVPFGKPIEEVYDGVQSGPVLGSGISGVVRLVTHKATGVKYAVKCLDLGLVDTEEGLMQLREEIFIMCQLDHPNIVRLEEVYESHSEIYLVQELCLGGELFDRLDEQPDYHYTEAECARLIKQMLCAVRYLHSKGIIHRDLKLENFLFSSSAPDSELKMIDFGLSKHFQYGEIQQQAVGTPYTVAPEVIRGRYDERCDIWAIGVIAFLLLSGDPPFGGCGGPEPLMVVRANILNGAFEFEPAEIWDLVSDLGKEFINALLVTNPKFRPTAMDAQKLSWLEEWAYRTKSDNDHILNPNVVRALVNFKEFSDMRKLLCEVLSFTLLPEQIKDLRKEFETLDTDGSGEISLLSLKQVLVTNAGAGSLGALTEEEVEDIFNAMRVKKTETTIRWHEFIAAGLSQCEVDDRNLRLAFDRLDNDHKGVSFHSQFCAVGVLHGISILY
jgi:calcium-dependent protein kinase